MRAYKVLCLAALLVFVTAAGFAATATELSGSGWTFRTTLDDAARPVSIPHCWLVEPGYERYIGHALYERDFNSTPTAPGQVVRLHFGAVYDSAQVWLNGKLLGTHEGGYTPFEFDITSLLHAGQNHLLVDVDNSPTLTSIPALATAHASSDGVPYGDAARATIVGWLPYGGITRPVQLLVTDAVYFRGVKIEATPVAGGSADLRVRMKLHNSSSQPRTITVQGSIGLEAVVRKARVPAGKDALVDWTGTLEHAHLWSVRDPYLYSASLTIAGDRIETHFGVRKVEVRGTELLLNGTPVHLFGANRVGEDLKVGALETDAVIQRDMTDMLADNMRMMRIAHYPQTQALLDFADRHGMLIIAEAGNWNMSSWQMANPQIRAHWQKQHREMMEADWNHPSVVAWSVGNEYESYTPDGLAWTRDMRAYTLSMDSTRLVTFASRFTSDPKVKTGADEASQYSDFVSINVYSDYAKRFDHAHELYPGKPIFVTEYGRMGEPGLDDPERARNIAEAVELMKARPWMIGGSLWAWNDYRSFFRGTSSDGQRHWGVVTADRERRTSWNVIQRLYDVPLP